jgi:tol-pal system protein YbgF
MTETASTPNVARRPVRSLALVLAVACAVAGSALPGTAGAQDIQTLMNRLNRLETEVDTLNRQVYRGGGGPVPLTGQSSGAAAGDLASGLAADFEVRLTRLERELQLLTGKYEETVFGISQARERLDAMQSDIDYRLSEIESRLSGGDAGAPSPAGSAGRADAPAGGDAGPPARSSDTGTRTASAGGSLPTGSAQEKYDHAFGLLRDADYPKAEAALQQFIAEHPDHALASNARYWLAETYYVRQKYREAAVAFAEGYQMNPKGSKAPDNLLKLGMSLAAMNQRDDACLTFDQLAKEFPDASAIIKRRADQERERLGCG